jgi:hypothetical protein
MNQYYLFTSKELLILNETLLSLCDFFLTNVTDGYGILYKDGLAMYVIKLILRKNRGYWDCYIYSIRMWAEKNPKFS